ncbi:hypothetical protein [Cryobacterium aureum]|uniref:hypothetical protein n=1 Tax=Cryobacterium aureum TaxID=995037 RepID=UPI000CF4D256|nr:hypothetical protein [Cryobacterium aureum]
MMLHELYLICHCALVVASPHLSVGHPAIVIMVAVGLLIGPTVIVALLDFVVARQFDPPTSSTQSGALPRVRNSHGR